MSFLAHQHQQIDPAREKQRHAAFRQAHALRALITVSIQIVDLAKTQNLRAA